MEITYRFRIYPTHDQEKLIQKTFGCCRFVYNYFLNQRIETFKAEGRTVGWSEQSRCLTQLKKQLTWLKEVDYSPLQAELKNIDRAFSQYFSSFKKQRGKKWAYPKFKSKHHDKKSYTTKNHKGPHPDVYISGRYIKLPKVGMAKCRISRNVDGRILNATIEQNKAGKYFVYLCCTDVDIDRLPSTGAVVGIDVGIKDFAITSDGRKYSNHRFLKSSEKKLVKLQRQLSRKTRGSSNWEKQRVKVARCHEHIANQRRDNMQKLTTDLIRKYDKICIENLHVDGLKRNHNMAGAVSDVAFYEFRRELEYKAAWYGRIVSVIDAFYPSSQLCHCCGYRNADTKNMSVREWTCPKCGTHHDRDENAAINILNEGLRLLS